MYTESLVIGNSVESLLFALAKEYHHLANTNFPPLFYESLPEPVLGSRNTREVWTRLKLYLSLMGRSVSHQDIEKIILEAGTCRVIANSTHEYRYKKCYVFNTENIVPDVEIVSFPPLKRYRVIDDLEIRNLSRDIHRIPSNHTESDFVKRVTFYTSDRIDGAKYVTDCVAESYLNEEQLYDLDYSDTMIKFYVQRLLLDMGYPGRVVGFLKNGQKKFYKPEVTHSKRLIFEMGETKYRNSETIVFIDKSLKEIVDELSPER